MRVILICATTLDGFIARDSNEITKWTKDLRLFKKQTIGSTVIVGSKTYKTIQKELKNRNIIVINRNSDPKTILNKLKETEDKCFIAGGGKTNLKFIKYITELYLTPHPLIFGDGVGLFDKAKIELNIELKKTIKVKGVDNLIQYQYIVNNIQNPEY